ncbi:hypothetical protein [Kitasatospora indigofera]|uniref:hypothetical protein n=1 Tax=Kitasatospora indigofera TaxID=67307 RepID=UPI0036831005
MAQALHLLNTSSAPLAPRGDLTILLAEIISAVPAWLDGLFAAAQAVAVDRPGSAELLEKSVTTLVQLRTQVAGTTRQRPQLAQIDALRRILDAVEQALRAYLGALSAASPLAAQALAAQAQENLDRAAVLTKDAGWLARATNRLGSLADPENVAGVLFEQALELYGSSDLLQLDTAGRHEIESILGTRGPQGCGLMFAMHDILARTLWDRQHFVQLVAQSYALLTTHADGVLAVVADQAFEDDLKAAFLEMFDSCAQITFVVRQTHVARQAGRALLDMAASLLEGPGKMMASMMLLAAGHKSKPYAKLRHDDATATVRMAQQYPDLAELFQGLDGGLRNARAHAAVQYLDHGIVLELRSSSRSMTWDEVTDMVFQAQEAMLAWQIALTVMLGERGIRSFGAPDLHRAYGMSAQRLIKVFLENMGCREVEVEVDGSHWRVEGGMTYDGPAMSLLVTVLLRLLPDSAATLALTGRYADGPHTLTGPLGPWREFTRHDADSEAYVTGMIRAELIWTYDSDPYFPGPALRRWTSQQVAETVDRPPSVAVRRLRELQDLAVIAEDIELHEALATAIRAVRLGKPDPDDRTSIELLRSWREKPVEFVVR